MSKKKISFENFRRKYGTFSTPSHSPQSDKDSVVPELMRLQLQKEPGIFFGTVKDSGDSKSYMKASFPQHYIGKPQSVDGHCAIFGSSGSGKGSCVAVPTMLSWGDSPMVVLDPKGDLSEYYMRMNSTEKRPVKIFNPAKDDTCTYDPFSHIRNDDKSNRVANIRELVNAIIPKPLDSKDRFWVAAAQKILTGAFLYFLDLEENGEEQMDFYAAIDAITSLPLEGEDGLLVKIKKNGTESAKKYIRSFMAKDDLSDSEMLMDINETLDTYLMNFINDMRIQKALVPSKDSIDWEKDIDQYNIFLSIPEDRIEQWGSLLNVMITQLIRTLERRPEYYSPQGANLKPVLLLLDEFPVIGRIDVLANALSMLRSKNVTILLIAQSISQLSAIYGHDSRNIMLENCDFQAVLRVNCAESQKYFSELAGTVPRLSWSIGNNYEYDRVDEIKEFDTVEDLAKFDGFEEDGIKPSSRSESVSIDFHPLVRPEELAHLDREMILFTPYRTFHVKKSPFYNWKGDTFALQSDSQRDGDSTGDEKHGQEAGHDGYTFKM